MKKHLVIALLCSLVATNAARVSAADVNIDSIVAVVNDGVVLSSELSSEVSYLKLQAEANKQDLPQDSVFRERVLERMVDQEIQRQHAAKLGVAVDASSVNRAIEQVAQGNNMSSPQFRETLISQGFDYDYYRKSIETELLLSRLIQRDVQSRIRVTKQEIDDFVSASKKSGQQQRYRVQHILLAVPASAAQAEVDKTLSRANSVLAMLRSGEDFSRIAAANSDGARALEGGDLGWRSLQELPDFLSTALISMAVGDISEPLRSPNGFHIVKLTDKSDQAKDIRTETLARHIFIASDTGSSQQKLEDLKRRIEAGEAFENLAQEFSEDPNSASNGGELPWFFQGQMPEEIESVALALEPGKLSEPFKTQFGWHLLEVLDRRQRDSTDDTVRKQAEQSLRSRKIEQETERWIRRLRDESFIEIRG